MRNHGKYLIFLAVTLAIQACSLLKKHSFEWIVMRERPPKTVEALPDYSSTLNCSKMERRMAERVLRQVYAEKYAGQFESNNPLHKFHRQYFIYMNSRNERVIFIQCFLKEVVKGRLVKEIGWRPVFDDGCESVFRVQVNLQTGQYFAFNINSCS
jgi:hypothetical protein